MIVIYHNPACETSRNVLSFIKATEDPVVIAYLEAGWTRGQLLGLFAAADVSPRQALRVSGTPAEALGLTDPAIADEVLLAAMVAHPILVNRPFVASPRGTRLCRPSEAVIPLLRPLSTPLFKEDGTEVAPHG
jgi:arsenate reductase (glutaredoxin)